MGIAGYGPTHMGDRTVGVCIHYRETRPNSGNYHMCTKLKLHSGHRIWVSRYTFALVLSTSLKVLHMLTHAFV